jgi:Tol biopolymer transport system component
LTTIAAPTSITYGGLTEAVPMVGTKFIFGPLTVSPDNRWIAFTPAQGGRLYLFFVKDGLEDIHPARVPETARRSNQNRFLAVANRNGTRLANVWFPAISPDGSRIAFVDTNTNKLRMALLRVADGAGDGVTLNFWEYTVDLELGVQLFSYPKLAWSPDGSKIIFAQNTEIHIVSGAAGDWTRAPGDPVPTVPTAKLVDAALTSNPSLEWVWRE